MEYVREESFGNHLKMWSTETLSRPSKPDIIFLNMKLNKTQIHWIIRQSRKWMATKEIACDMKVSTRRVQQILKEYYETGKEPPLGENLGRPAKPYD